MSTFGKLFVKAVITGFAWNLGASIYKKVQGRLGFPAEGEEPAKAKQQGGASSSSQDSSPDPGNMQVAH